MDWQMLAPIFIYLAILMGVGYYSRVTAPKSKTFAEGYFLGGRSLGPFLLVFTMTASLASVGTFIGAPGLIYSVGAGFLIAGLAQLPVIMYSLGALGKKIAIVSRRIDAVTLTDLFKARYQNDAVVIGSALAMIIFIVVYMMAQIVGGTRIIEAITGLPYTWGLVIFFVVVVTYTVLGGFRAVAITDLLQGLIMMVGAVVLVVIVVAKSGGLGVLSATVIETTPHLFTLPGPMNMTPLYFISFFMLFGIGVIGMPTMVLRSMAYKDSKSMHQAILMGIVVMTLFTVPMGLMGLFARVHFPALAVPDMAVPSMVLEFLPPWFAGVFMTVPLVAVMSTIDAMLLIVCSSIVIDIIRNYIKPKASDESIKKMSYLFTFLIAIVVFVFALSPPALVQMVVIYAVGGLIAAFFVPLLFGLYWRRANGWGAACSLFGGMVSYILLEIFANRPLGMHTITSSLIISIVLMIVVSLLTAKPSAETINLFWGSAPSEQK